MPRITLYEPADLTHAYDQVVGEITHACGAGTPGERALCSIVIYLENEGIAPTDAAEVLASIDPSDAPENEPETDGAADVVRCALRDEGISGWDGGVLVGRLMEWMLDSTRRPSSHPRPRSRRQTHEAGSHDHDETRTSLTPPLRRA